MEATQKAKNITVKTLDSSITRKKATDGSISTLRYADIPISRIKAANSNWN
jgi:hypothetical protein